MIAFSVAASTPASNFLRALASRVRPPKAILVVSAHWEEARPTVGLGTDTIHDFYGFPKPLYELQYPAPLARDIAERHRMLSAAVERKVGHRHHGVAAFRGQTHGPNPG